MTVHRVMLNGVEPVILPDMQPGDVYVIERYCTGTRIGTILFDDCERITSEPNRGPYASHEPWKKRK